MKVKYCILGAGPTGLAAAWRLREKGRDDFLVLERADHAGGLAASHTDSAGFTWDIGGHVVFSHYDYFDRLLDGLLGEDYLEHQRVARVRAAGTWVPYPFQNNIRHLPEEERWECVRGLLPGHRPEGRPENFAQWFDVVFGPGVARIFMRPYNFKVWATPPEDMAFQWIGERVSVVDLESVLERLVRGQDDDQWGPNNAFRFPLFGGTGEIYRRLAKRVEDRVLYGREVVQVDPVAREVLTATGERIGYELLLSTLPLDLLVGRFLTEAPDAQRQAAGNLAHNGVRVCGVGVEGTRQDPTCWMYFPENDCPFYRLTNFHNYSPNNVAKPGEQRALMAETSFSEHKPEDLGKLAERTVDGLVATTMLDRAEAERSVASVWEYTADYGYPVPTLGRDAALALLQPWLEERSIYSRGRFGGWKYEVSNMDHSVMQGVEWADRMLEDTPETTYAY